MTWKLQSKSIIMTNDEELFTLQFIDAEYVDGKLMKQLAGKTPFKANVQPLTGRELLLVPEHQRFLEQYWCYVPKKDCGMFFFNKTGDVVLRDATHYQVQAVEYWGSYQRVRIMRVDVGEYSNP